MISKLGGKISLRLEASIDFQNLNFDKIENKNYSEMVAIDMEDL